MTSVNDPDAALDYHRLTRHGSRVEHPERLVSFRPLDPSNRPAPFKRYADREPVPLPREVGGTGVAATELLSGTFTAPPAPLGATVVARLLFYAAGVTRTSTSPDGSRSYFRAAMSAGNLHPVELYVVSGGIPGVPEGVHHFAPVPFALTPIRDIHATAPLALVLTGLPWRTGWKYGERGFRHLYWDAGTLLANLLAVADAHGLDPRVHVGFVDDAVADLVGIDGVTEVPLAVVTFGAPDALPVPEDRVAPRVGPLSAQPISFPLVDATQAAGALPDANAVDRWLDTAASLQLIPATRALAPPAGSAGASIEEVILRRGSTRIMRRETGREALLTWAMGAASRPVTSDFAAAGTTLLEHFLSVHAVDGVTPGAYRWRAGGLEAGQHGDLRTVARQLTLDQPLGGDSCFTAFHAADLDDVLGALGGRGYRAALLEAGIASGRLSLAAFALGYGATGLTFFDEAVRQFFGTNATCMLVTSVGVPAYRNTSGGTPDTTAELRHFDDLMLRLSRQLHAGGDF